MACKLPAGYIWYLSTILAYFSRPNSVVSFGAQKWTVDPRPIFFRTKINRREPEYLPKFAFMTFMIILTYLLNDFTIIDYTMIVVIK